MKGLFCAHLDRKQEAHDLIKRGIRQDITSAICKFLFFNIQAGMSMVSFIDLKKTMKKLSNAMLRHSSMTRKTCKSREIIRFCKFRCDCMKDLMKQNMKCWRHGHLKELIGSLWLFLIISWGDLTWPSAFYRVLKRISRCVSMMAHFNRKKCKRVLKILNIICTRINFWNSRESMIKRCNTWKPFDPKSLICRPGKRPRVWHRVSNTHSSTLPQTQSHGIGRTRIRKTHQG